MDVDAERLRRIGHQHAETARLMGVDFLPVRKAGSGPVVATEAPKPPTPAREHSREVVRPAAHAAPAAAVPSAAALPAVGGSTSRTREEKAAALAALRAEHDARCPHCTRATAHTQTVFGDGDPDAALMFVGEAPGAEEDRQGIPFVGASGKKLTEMIKAMGFDRSQVYIANVLKARPPNNDTPTPDEAAKCGPYLARQIEIIAPAVIVTLGKPAVSYLLDTRETMTNLRGRWFEFRGIPVMPTFHPAFLLRQYTPENRQKVWSDLKQALTKLEEMGRGPVKG